MQLTCPDCQVDCTFDEELADTATCPGCGVLLYSRSGNSGPLTPRLALASGKQAEVDGNLEKTRQWQKTIDDNLPVPDQFPQRLGRYELRKKLGEGSFAEVYLAFDSALSREVALKVPKRSRFSSAEQLRRFLDEGRTSAILEHPGIVRVYDIGWISEELCFISMEYCSGGSLSDRLKSEPLTCDQAVELVKSLAEAIHFAHVAGFVHRDLKPSNIMFGRDGRPRIVDFGLALSDAEQLNHAGEVAGTLPYMSPEQIRGDAHHLDGRTDIWSLGVILYQMLVGRRPFSGSKSQIIEQIRNREAKPLRQIKDDIPAELETICLRCLQKSAADRYYTAKDLAHELHSFRVRQPKSALHVVPTPPIEPSIQAKLSIKSRLAWVGIAMLFLVTTLGISFAFGLFRPGRNELPKIPDPENQLVPQLPNFDSEPTGVWHPLLQTKPREFFWENGGLPWSYDSQSQRVTMSSNREGILELGEWSSTDYNVSLDLHRYAWSKGGAGVLWGIHDIEIDPKNTHDAGAEAEIQATAFFFSAEPFPGKPTAYVVGIYDVRYWRHPNARIMVVQDAIAEIPISEPTLSRVNLKLEIGGAGPIRILWGGQPLDKLVDKFNSKFRGKKLPAYQSQGRMGIINFIGSTTFSGAQVQLNNK